MYDALLTFESWAARKFPWPDHMPLTIGSMLVPLAAILFLQGSTTATANASPTKTTNGAGQSCPCKTAPKKSATGTSPATTLSLTPVEITLDRTDTQTIIVTASSKLAHAEIHAFADGKEILFERTGASPTVPLVANPHAKIAKEAPKLLLRKIEKDQPTSSMWLINATAEKQLYRDQQLVFALRYNGQMINAAVLSIKPRLPNLSSVVAINGFVDGEALEDGEKANGEIRFSNTSSSTLFIDEIRIPANAPFCIAYIQKPAATTDADNAEKIASDNAASGSGSSDTTNCPKRLTVPETQLKPLSISPFSFSIARDEKHPLPVGKYNVHFLTSIEREGNGGKPDSSQKEYVSADVPVSFDVPIANDLKTVLGAPSLLILPGLLFVISFYAAASCFIREPTPTSADSGVMSGLLSRANLIFGPGLWFWIIFLSGLYIWWFASGMIYAYTIDDIYKLGWMVFWGALLGLATAAILSELCKPDKKILSRAQPD